ncbi:MAG TPA: site-2 protease family protein [Longimicrobium sp.]|jgi:Zn-dependent protease|uniref:site-2 protease family protein n=1 Tax=Longimicrobium sp. TaxID=2029185 RepID=UPI002EDAB3DE
MQFDLEAVLLALPILLLSLTAHEFAHAWVALKQGDDTAYKQGRVTMNPAAHVDIIGTLVFPALAIASGMPLLGWAKPVPTNPANYRNYKRGDILVSIAGVCANAILAVFFALVALVLFWALAATSGAASDTLGIAFQMALYGVIGNVGLIIFNLLPIPPLDGSHVMYHMLPPDAAASYRQIYPYGFIILWALVLTNALDILWPVIRGISRVLLAPIGIPLL